MSEARLEDWIGKSQTTEDALDLGHAARIAATLGEIAPEKGQPLSPLWHWCFFLESVPMTGLGTDGHPARGGFLPPAEGRNRMWAGGRVSFEGDLLAGIPATRTSTVSKITEKQGKTGSLLFVTVTHEVSQSGKRVVLEEQDIVYRTPSPPKLQGTEPAPEAQWSKPIEPTPTWLFRYSALTFNGHRIHYDFPYVTEVEGYPGLVVHGPLIATSMVQSFREANPGVRVTHLAYRGLRPLICPTPFEAQGSISEEGVAQIWAAQDGTLAHQAELRFEK
ncbi:FAS1-like dehydratase domain-containing protein [Orrella marina]|uniref:Itaconyl-CoA hydratase n=1 Tax=Orrella marina TaxID=2163011 RepID=A0A2R4XN94_9BURK|nr:MaoC family dehydratase N-terminal domain-containing protein [Orrella marina]AWB35282.1 itaconyl-CoA hydratase [Orrella marina]